MDKILDQEKAMTYLEKLPIITQPTNAQVEALKTLFGHKGFEVLLGLLMGEKQAIMVQLANLPLVGENNQYQAAVRQGHIAGIEAVRNTMLSEAYADDPTQEKN